MGVQGGRVWGNRGVLICNHCCYTNRETSSSLRAQACGADDPTEAGFRSLVGNMEEYLGRLLRRLHVSFTRQGGRCLLRDTNTRLLLLFISAASVSGPGE